MSTIERLAIVNRGAAAMRLINGAREYAEDHRRPLRIVALHMAADRGALFVREADEAVMVEEPATTGPVAAIERALVRAAIDAAWVGWGPLAQQSSFAAMCDRIGVIDVGLGSECLDTIADRAVMADLAHACGLALSPLSLIERGYPRHIEVLVAGDGQGAARVLGIHDGTLQRRSEKILVETPGPALNGVDELLIRSAALRLVDLAGIVGVATIAFAHADPGEPPSLLRISGGLPLGHGVTEITSGVDLAKVQLHIAEGGRLEGAPPHRDGHAIAVRLNAEDAELGFAPAPGRVALLQVPTGPGLRIDPALAEGDVVRPGEDPMLAEVVAWGRDRNEARVRLRRALQQLPVVLDGGTTNKGFLLDLLDRDEVIDGDYDTTWLDRLAASGETTGRNHGEVAVLMAAVDAYDEQQRRARDHLFATARRGRPSVDAAVGRTFELCHHGNEYALTVRRTGRRRYRVAVDGSEVTLVVTRLQSHQSRVEIGTRTHRVVSAIQGGDHLVEVDGVPHRLVRGDGGLVYSPTPGVVVAVHVAVGDVVRADDVLVTLESMKMESAVLAPFGGTVRRVHAGTNVQVDSGAALVQLVPTGRVTPVASERRLSFAELDQGVDTSADARAADDLDLLTRLVMGYDIGASAAQSATDAQAELADQFPEYAGRMVADEIRLLTIFADLRLLFRSERDVAESDLQVRSPQEYLHAFLRAPGPTVEGVSPRFLSHLRRALTHYGIDDLEHTEALEEALFWIMQSRQRVAIQIPVIVAILERWLAHTDHELADELRGALDHLVGATQRDHPVVADLAREVRYEIVERPLVDASRQAVLAAAMSEVEALITSDDGQRGRHIDALVACPEPLANTLLNRAGVGDRRFAGVVAELLTRRHHRWGPLGDFGVVGDDAGPPVLVVEHRPTDDEPVTIVASCAPYSAIDAAIHAACGAAGDTDPTRPVNVEIHLWPDTDAVGDEEFLSAATHLVEGLEPSSNLGYLVIALATRSTADQPAGGWSAGEVRHLTFRPGPDGWLEDRFLRGLHPMVAKRLELWRFSNFALEFLTSPPGINLFRAVAHDNPADERLFAVAEVRDLTPVRDESGRLLALPELERTLLEAMEGIRRFQAPRAPGQRLWWNRIQIEVWPPLAFDLDEIGAVAMKIAPAAIGLGLEEVTISCLRPDPATGEMRRRTLRFSATAVTRFEFHETPPPTEALEPLDEYTRKVVQSRRRSTVYPYELLRGLVAPGAGGRADITGGDFVEHDLDEQGRLVPVDRPPGRNVASIVTGVVTNRSDRHPEGMARVVLLGDPTRALGALAEPECARINAALDLAEDMGVPVEWFALSAGAKIAMDSGTENMDWIAAVLRRIIEFTQAGGEINVVVTGINVGAQPYWNAEATMLMHTKGILVMTPDSAMVLTGKQALDFSGGVSAEDNHGIGGYERVMGPNGQAQYWARDLTDACGVLLAHYAHSYVVPGERFPRRARTNDPFDRDVRSSPHRLAGSDLQTVGDIFSESTNPDRKKPFDMRSVMAAVMDDDHPVLERWADLAESDTAVIWSAHLGGIPVCAIGIEAHALPRQGHLPADGPEQWTSGTLFPMSSKKIARAVNAASGSEPIVVLANLSGFDGSPESMRRRQLEFGAEIGRAVVNFRGPIVFCVVSRFHGGAFVVFSQQLNDRLETLAVEGAHASVIGGSPAAAVVFAGEVERRSRLDPRRVELEAQLAAATEGSERARLRRELAALIPIVRSDQLGAVAAEFDAVHSVERAQAVGSVTGIIPAASLRPLLIDAVERGIARELADTDRPA